MRSLLVILSVLLLAACVVRGQMDLYADDDYQLYAVVDADDFDVAQFGFGGAGFGGVGGAGKGLGALPTVVQCDGGKHGGGCLGGGRHGKHGGGALNIIVGVPTPVPTPVPVPTYTPMATVGRVHYEPQVYQGKQQVQVPVTTKQQFQGQAYVPQTAKGAYGGF